MKKKYFLWLIFALALLVRFYAFRESVYFGFDQARDAYISQEIFLKRDIKLIGPPVSGDVGLFHGPLYWYLIGPIYLLFKGDPAMVSGTFRVFNALGIFLIYGIGDLLFGSFVGIVSAFLYAISFEESQYSFYVGNPALGVITIMTIFFGAALIFKKNKYAKWSPLLMLGGAALSTQMNLMFVYTIFMVAALVLFLRKNARKITIKYWLLGLVSAVLILSTFLAVEIKYEFRSVKLAITLFQRGYGVMGSDTSKYILFLGKFFRMFRDNLIGIDNYMVIGILAVLMSVWILLTAVKSKSYQILTVWLFGWVFLMLLGGHTAYYTNVGLGGAILMSTAIIVEKIYHKNRLIAGIILGLITFGNLRMVLSQSPNSLLKEIIVQPMMKLSDEYRMIDQMYMEANGKGFTVRMTGVPYKIQTVWAYLFHFYGENKYGYLPYWETGNVLGFPGEMPAPKSGTTCLRFLGREPTHGLPQVLVDYDEKLERDFSTVIQKIDIGDYTLETRQSIDADCHNNKP